MSFQPSYAPPLPFKRANELPGVTPHLNLEQVAALGKKFNVNSHGWNSGHTESWKDEEFVGMINRCIDVLDAAPRRVSKGASRDSYGLKHAIEGSDCQGYTTYICNGAVILAAYHLGLKVWVEPGGAPNALIGTGYERDAY